MRRLSLVLTLLCALLLPSLALAAPAGRTEITWLGHSAFKVVTPSGKVLLIDPWVKNPANKEGEKQLGELKQVDLLLVTHAHSDHVGDLLAIAAQSKAKLVGTFDLVKALVQGANFPAEQTGYATSGAIGGEIELLDGEVRIAFIPALHGSTLETGPGTVIPGRLMAAGNPCGFLISIKNGPVIYHTGDTDLFSDMALVKTFRMVDVMLTCIGDHFTMGPIRAAKAVKLVGPKVVVPMHYGTFPVLTGTPEVFKKAVRREAPATRVKVLAVGETLRW